MNVGYGYLVGSPRKADTEEPQIKDMDLEHIRKYMCPISNGDFRRCLNCQGLKTCQTGQRVAVLLAERDKKNELTKWKRVMDVNPNNPGNVDDDRRKVLRDACESGNAWGYIMRVTGQSQGAAKETLLGLIRKYPGIAAEYGGSRRIMQRPRLPMSISAEEPAQAQQTANETAPEAQEHATQETMEPPVTEQPENKKPSRRGLAAREKMTARTVATIREALATGDPMKYLMEVRGNDLKNARQTLGRWKQGHPELFEEAKTEPEAVQAPDPKPEPLEDGDTISLEEFLGQYAQPEPKEPAEVPIREGGEEQADILGRIQESAMVAMDALMQVIRDSHAGDNHRVSAAKVVLDFYTAAKKEGWV